MRVFIRFFTSLREITGKKEEILRFQKNEKVTIADLLRKLAEEYGQAFAEYVYDRKTGEVKSHLQFLINGRSSSTMNGLSTVVRDGDVLAIIPPVGGG